jgi:hypothetical protein
MTRDVGFQAESGSFDRMERMGRMDRMNLLDKNVFRANVDAEPFTKVPETCPYPVNPPHPPHPVQSIRDSEPC